MALESYLASRSRSRHSIHVNNDVDEYESTFLHHQTHQIQPTPSPMKNVFMSHPTFQQPLSSLNNDCFSENTGEMNSVWSEGDDMAVHQMMPNVGARALRGKHVLIEGFVWRRRKRVPLMWKRSYGILFHDPTDIQTALLCFFAHPESVHPFQSHRIYSASLSSLPMVSFGLPKNLSHCVTFSTTDDAVVIVPEKLPNAWIEAIINWKTTGHEMNHQDAHYDASPVRPSYESRHVSLERTSPVRANTFVHETQAQPAPVPLPIMSTSFQPTLEKEPTFAQVDIKNIEKRVEKVDEKVRAVLDHVLAGNDNAEVMNELSQMKYLVETTLNEVHGFSRNQPLPMPYREESSSSLASETFLSAVQDSIHNEMEATNNKGKLYHDALMQQVHALQDKTETLTKQVAAVAPEISSKVETLGKNIQSAFSKVTTPTLSEKKENVQDGKSTVASKRAFFEGFQKNDHEPSSRRNDVDKELTSRLDLIWTKINIELPRYTAGLEELLRNRDQLVKENRDLLQKIQAAQPKQQETNHEEYATIKSVTALSQKMDTLSKGYEAKLDKIIDSVSIIQENMTKPSDLKKEEGKMSDVVNKLQTTLAAIQSRTPSPTKAMPRDENVGQLKNELIALEKDLQKRVNGLMNDVQELKVKKSVLMADVRALETGLTRAEGVSRRNSVSFK